MRRVPTCCNNVLTFVQLNHNARQSQHVLLRQGMIQMEPKRTICFVDQLSHVEAELQVVRREVVSKEVLTGKNDCSCRSNRLATSSITGLRMGFVFSRVEMTLCSKLLAQLPQLSTLHLRSMNFHSMVDRVRALKAHSSMPSKLRVTGLISPCTDGWALFRPKRKR